jgi:hypothetical protein
MLRFGVLTASRGAAIVASGFVTEALVKEESSSISGYGGGTKWEIDGLYGRHHGCGFVRRAGPTCPA